MYIRQTPISALIGPMFSKWGQIRTFFLVYSRFIIQHFSIHISRIGERTLTLFKAHNLSHMHKSRTKVTHA